MKSVLPGDKFISGNLCYPDTPKPDPYPYPIRTRYGYAPDTAPIRIRYASWRIGLRGVSLTP